MTGLRHLLFCTIFIALVYLTTACQKPPAQQPPAQLPPAKREEWPELVGKTKEEAKTQILKDRPDVTVYFVLQGSFVAYDNRTNRVFTLDYRIDRVRVWHDVHDIVIKTPVVG